MPRIVALIGPAVVPFGVAAAEVEVDRVEDLLLFELREHRRLGTPVVPGAGRVHVVGGQRRPHREHVLRGVVIVHSHADLLEVVQALRAAGRLARRLHCGQQERDQDRDDSDHHQELDQGETVTLSSIWHASLRSIKMKNRGRTLTFYFAFFISFSPWIICCRMSSSAGDWPVRILRRIGRGAAAAAATGDDRKCERKNDGIKHRLNVSSNSHERSPWIPRTWMTGFVHLENLWAGGHEKACKASAAEEQNKDY